MIDALCVALVDCNVAGLYDFERCKMETRKNINQVSVDVLQKLSFAAK